MKIAVAVTMVFLMALNSLSAQEQRGSVMDIDISPAALPAGQGAEIQTNYTSIPYAKMLKDFSLDTHGLSVTSMVIKARFVYRNAHIQSSDIETYIASTKGRLPVPKDKDGWLAFPVTDTLVTENPAVQVSHPKGRIKIEVSVNMSAPIAVEGNRIRYATLMAGVRIANEKLDYLEAIGGPQKKPRMMIALKLIFKGVTTNSAVVIKDKTGDIVVKVSPNGVVIIPDVKSQFNENPWVELPTNCTGVATKTPRPINWDAL